MLHKCKNKECYDNKYIKNKEIYEQNFKNTSPEKDLENLNKNNSKFQYQLKFSKNSIDSLETLIKSYNICEKDLLTTRNVLKKNIQQKNIKNQEINIINDKISECIQINHELKSLTQLENLKRRKIDEEKKKLSNFLNNMNEKYDNIKETIKNYEEEIQSLQDDNQTLNDEYISQINKIEDKNFEILNNLQNRKVEDALNIEKTRELQLTLEQLDKERVEKKIFYEERMMLKKMQYDFLEKKFKEMEKRIFEISLKKDLKNLKNNLNTEDYEKDRFRTSILADQIKTVEIENLELLSKYNKNLETIKTSKLELGK